MASSPKSSGSGYSAEMDEAERASRDEMTALQTRRLAWTLAHAYDNVAHYKKAFDKAGVHPSDFRQLSDLAKFPFTVKTDLRDNYPFNMFAAPAKTGPRPRSSGTTGKPTWSDIQGRYRHGRMMARRSAPAAARLIIHNAYVYGLSPAA
jgi:phenylacetate-CoA ligase